MFPIPEICGYLTRDTKNKVFYTAELDDQGSKVSDFFEKTDDMFNEMKWQKKLRGNESRNYMSNEYKFINLTICLCRSENINNCTLYF